MRGRRKPEPGSYPSVIALRVERTYTVELDLGRFIQLWVALTRFLEAAK